MVIATALISAFHSFAQVSPDGWRTPGSLRGAGDQESAKVKVVAQGSDFIDLTYSMPPAKAVKVDSEKDRVFLGNAPHSGEPGMPRLPVVPARVLIPSGREVANIEVVRGRKSLVEGKHYVEFAEQPFPLVPGVKALPATANAAVYASDQAYPAQPYTVVGVQKKRGASILFVNLIPIEYRAATGELFCYDSLTVRVSLRTIKQKAAVRYRASTTADLGEWVDNPDTLATYSESTSGFSGPAPLGLCNPTGHVLYVAITSEEMKNARTDVSITNLVAQRRAQGISAEIVTVESIYANYTGVDNAEKVRNFILDAYNNWETEYVLLGGDTGVVPMRKLYCVASGYIDDIPSDVYYQCLDGTYNYDNDASWGETTDGVGGGDVDLLAEVSIGRASAENTNEMANFVYKTLRYENEAEASEYLRRALMCGEYLGFGGISQYATATMEEIRWGSNTNGYSTVGFASCPLFQVDGLYDSDTYSWAKSNIVQSINSGAYSIINHLGHANYNYVMKFYNADADALTNRNVMFAYSQGCIPGNFEADCVAEHLTTSTRFGMYAVVFNARYGWGRYSSTDGPSQRFDRQFWDAYFGEHINSIGAINADSHEDNIWDINGSCIRWCFYESNLLGDPYTPMRGQYLVDSITLTPADTFAAAGGVGGPFSPSSKTYSLHNTSSDLPLSWSVSCASNWISLAPTNGTLAAGAYTSFVATVNANANGLGEARYNATLMFTNRTNGKGSTVRAVELMVNNPPRITNSSIQAGAVLTAGSLTYTAQFNERMQAATLDSSDFALRGELSGLCAPVTWSYNTNTLTLTLQYANLAEDEYTLTLYSGDGRFEDLEGLNLDGEAVRWPIPTNFTGNGAEGGDFVVPFGLDAGTVAYPVPLLAKKPYGSLIYDPSVSAYIRLNDTDRFTIALDSNQTLTVVVDPADLLLRPRVDLFNPAGSKVASATGTAAGACALLQTIPVTAAGTYAFEVAGVGTSTGAYSARVVLNAAMENESCDGPTNDTTATAQSLSNSFVTLLGTASRGAVMGRTESGASDYFAFNVLSNDLVTLAATAILGDAPALELYTPAGVLAASGRTGPENVSQVVENYRVGAPGRYCARVTGLGGDYSLVVMRNGSFDLEPNSALTNAQDLGGSALLLGAIAASAAPIATETEPNDDGLVGCTSNDLAAANDWSGSFTAVSSSTYRADVTGVIPVGSDADWDFFRIHASPGDSLTVLENKGTLSDPYVRVFDRYGTVLGYDDDSGGNLNSRLTVTNFAYSGEYYVAADSYGVSTGSYVLTAYHTTPIPPVRTDDDFMRVNLAAGESLVLQTQTPGDGSNEFVNTLDPMLELYDPSGSLVASNDNGAADSRNALVRYNATLAGTYTVRVRASRGSGEYVVSLPRRLGPLQVLFRETDSVVRESGGTVTLPVILTGATSSPVRVNYSIAGGTATAGADYSLATGTLVIAAGQLSTSLTVSVLNDAVSEGTETILVRLTSPVNAQLGEYQTNRCVIVDDERPLTLSFAAGEQMVAESCTQAVLTVVRSGGSDGRVTADFTTRDGTAVKEDDYGVAMGTLVFEDGVASNVLLVPIEKDTLEEADETFSVDLANPGGLAVLGSPATSTVTILDFKMPRTNMLMQGGFEQGIAGAWGKAGQVGWSSWAGQSGTSGVYMAGWNGYGDGTVSQRVNVARGTYTFALWARREEGYNQQETLLKLEWLDAAGNQVRAATVANWNTLPGDGEWHHLFVTGKCTNMSLVAVRGVFYSRFDLQTSTHCSLMIDNASLYAGVYTGVCALSNGEFDEGEANEWRCSSWHAVPERVANGRESWAGRPDGWGAALYGWDAASNDYTTLIGQNLVPGCGTYTFSGWFKREANFWLTNMEIRLAWYDATFTNRVQEDSVTRFLVANDNDWHFYHVSGTCRATNLFEVRAEVFVQFQRNSNEVPLRALMMDDALFYRGILDTDQDAMPDNWESRYFNDANSAQPDDDADHDGVSNYREYVGSTDPTNPASAFCVDMEAGPSRNQLSFFAATDRVYTVQFSTNLLPSPSWRNVCTGICGQGQAMCMPDVSGQSNGYYRLRVSLP